MSGDVVSEGTYYDHHTISGGHTTSGGRVFGVTPFLYADCERYGCQPRVVIDPESREQAERVKEAWYDAGVLDVDRTDQMQAALRSLIEPPRPDEPTGLGAVVEDADGARWVRIAEVDFPWARSMKESRLPNELFEWTEIKAVRVLSDGVTA